MTVILCTGMALLLAAGTAWWVWHERRARAGAAHIVVDRIFNSAAYCISHVYAEGQYVCDAIEDVDRGLDQQMAERHIGARKVADETAIPTGTYRVAMNVVSPKFSKIPYYRDFCQGRVPRLLGVKGFKGILIHMGEDQDSTSGCLIMGYNRQKGKVTDSRDAFEKLYALLHDYDRQGRRILLTVKRSY